MLASGLGGPFEAWQDLIAALPQGYRYVSWDYRGFHHSQVPPSGKLGVEENARDLLKLLEEEGVHRGFLMGWSMGAQVVLELYRLAPERVQGLVLLCGTAQNPFRAVTLAPEPLVSQVTRFFMRFPEIPRSGIELLMRFPEALAIVQSLGVVSRSASRKRLLEILEAMKGVDWSRYFANLLELSRHSAEDLLPHLKVPVLLVAGEKDTLTPPQELRRVAEKIPEARLLVVPGATHYAPVEEPELIAKTLHAWIQETLSQAR